MSKQKLSKRKYKPCPNPPKGERCPVCGGDYVCLDHWRKELVNGRKILKQEGKP